MSLLFDFFAPHNEELYKPCGMFTLPHFIAIGILAIILSVLIYLSRNLSKDKIKFITKILALVITGFELGKIIYSFYYGYTWPDAWVPLAFCSLFIYSLYMSGFAKGVIEKIGQSYIAGGGILAGLFFILFPTTSLMRHPLLHYMCFHSLIFHGAMFYLGIVYLMRKAYTFNLKEYKYYIIFVSIFSIIAIIINIIFDCNMMFYKEPYNMPIKLVVDIYNFSKVIYTLFIFIAYSSLYLLTYLFYLLIKKITKRRTN